MGKPLNQQRRGKGSPTFRAPSHRYKCELKYRSYDELEKNVLAGEVIRFVDDPGRDAVLMEVLFENGEKHLFLAPEGIKIGDRIEVGANAKLDIGCVLPLEKIPDGMPVYAIEGTPGDGGKFVRGAGGVAYVVSHEGEKVVVRLPSKELRTFNAKCRATIGVINGGGRLELPLLKAGKNYYKMKARNKYWPKVRGVAMNPYDHPFGGKEHHIGKASTIARNAPPGKKVGHIAARAVGRGAKKVKGEKGG